MQVLRSTERHTAARTLAVFSLKFGVELLPLNNDWHVATEALERVWRSKKEAAIDRAQAGYTMSRTCALSNADEVVLQLERWLGRDDSCLQGGYSCGTTSAALAMGDDRPDWFISAEDRLRANASQ